MAETLTGRRQFRAHKRWLREPLLVLQVEVHRVEAKSYDDFVGMSFPGCDMKYWRDATVQDLMKIEAVHRAWPVGTKNG